jgi:hypothetical protein
MSAESRHLEAKARFDGSPRAKLQLVKEIVAFANTDGGSVTIGLDDDGNVVGVDEATISRLDPARVADLLKANTAPETIEVDVRLHREGGKVVIYLTVTKFDRPPLVMAKDGNRADDKGGQVSEFREGDIYVRVGTKAQRASRKHFERWTEAAVEEERNRWRSNIEVLRNLGPGDSVQPVIAGEPLDGPAALIDRATREWKRDRAKLLTGQDLALLLLASGGMSFNSEQQELIIHSALRRKPTLWHWIAKFLPSPTVIKTLLLEAVDGKDRDKSDAGRSIIELSACLLEPMDHDDVIASLEGSSYAHFSEAAKEGRHASNVVDRLRTLRNRPVRSVDLTMVSEVELSGTAVGNARVLSTEGRHMAEAKELSRIGLERFARSPLGRALR